jgi:hypothetical protein
MHRHQLLRQLQDLTHRLPIDSFQIRQISKQEFRVRLKLTTGTPVSEALLLRLESSFDEEVTGLSALRIEDHLEIRFTIRFSTPSSDRCQENTFVPAFA